MPPTLPLGFFTMTVTGGAGGIFRVELKSNSFYKGTVGVSFSYGDSPSPVPVISPASVSLYVPCCSKVSTSVSVGTTVGWILDVIASDGTQTDAATVAV